MINVTPISFMIKLIYKDSLNHLCDKYNKNDKGDSKMKNQKQTSKNRGNMSGVLSEKVSIKISLPKPLYEFIKNYAALAKIPIEEFILLELKSSIDALINEIVDIPYLSKEEIIKAYNLKEMFD